MVVVGGRGVGGIFIRVIYVLGFHLRVTCAQMAFYLASTQIAFQGGYRALFSHTRGVRRGGQSAGLCETRPTQSMEHEPTSHLTRVRGFGDCAVRTTSARTSNLAGCSLPPVKTEIRNGTILVTWELVVSRQRVSNPRRRPCQRGRRQARRRR